MSRTLANVLALAEPKCSNASKDHLGPDQDGHGLADNAVPHLHNATNLAVDALFEMQSQVYSHDDLAEEQEHERRCEFGVDVAMQEFAAAVHVAERIAQ